jgi:hypothetical protein
MRQSQSEAFDTIPASIALFCSVGRHFEGAVHELKRRFPRARLTVVGPRWRTEHLHEAGVIDNLVDVSRDKLHFVKDFRECVRIVAAIRHDQCDLFVTMYDSTALNVLHSFSGCRGHAVLDVRGNFYPLKVSRFYLVRVILGSAVRALLGGLAYALIRATLCLWGSLRKRC